jgi:DNA polymerase
VFDTKADLSIQSGIMFVGEGPGKTEQEGGVPFSGPAGNVLDAVLGRLGLERSRVYVSNVVKCRACENDKDRAPSPEEVKSCSDWLRREIELLKPRVVVPLGQTAFNRVVARPVSGGISNFAGQVYGGERIASLEGVTIIPLVHPAATLYGFEKKKYLAHVELLKELLECGNLV